MPELQSPTLPSNSIYTAVEQYLNSNYSPLYRTANDLFFNAHDTMAFHDFMEGGLLKVWRLFKPTSFDENNIRKETDVMILATSVSGKGWVVTAISTGLLNMGAMELATLVASNLRMDAFLKVLDGRRAMDTNEYCKALHLCDIAASPLIHVPEKTRLRRIDLNGIAGSRL